MKTKPKPRRKPPLNMVTSDQLKRLTPFRWHTADGRDLLVTEMDDEHLENAILHIRNRIYPEMEPAIMEQSAVALRHFLNEQKRRAVIPRTTAIIAFTKEEVLILAEHATFPWTMSAMEHNTFSAGMRKLQRKAEELKGR
jgi:hypothetical protein